MSHTSAKKEHVPASSTSITIGVSTAHVLVHQNGSGFGAIPFQVPVTPHTMGETGLERRVTQLIDDKKWWTSPEFVSLGALSVQLVVAVGGGSW